MNLDALKVRPRHGSDPFHHGGQPLDFDLHSFWQWYCSDLCSNLLRGVIAEFLVARAVGAVGGVRNEWDAYDVLTPEGIKVEVKSGAYLQTWAQKKLSAISFEIKQKLSWDAATNVSATKAARFADVYVFAVLAHKDKATLDPLDVSQWEFLVLPTSVIDERCKEQKRIALSSLTKLGPVKVGFGKLRDAIVGASSIRSVRGFSNS